MCKSLRGLAEDPEAVLSGGGTRVATEAMSRNSQTSPHEGCFTLTSFPVSVLHRLWVVDTSRKRHSTISRRIYGAKIAAEPGCGMCKILRDLAEDPEVVLSGGATQFATEAMNQNAQTSPYECCFTFTATSQD